MSLILGNKTLAGSMIGGIAETQEMLDFCAAKKITADVEVIPAGEDQRGLRADAEERRAVPVRDRHQDTEILSPAA